MSDREQKLLDELQALVQGIHQRTGCVLRETTDDPPKLTCAEPLKSAPPRVEPPK